MSVVDASMSNLYAFVSFPLVQAIAGAHPSISRQNAATTQVLSGATFMK